MDVDDQRVVCGAALDLKEPSYGRRIKGVGSQAVDGFGGEGNGLAVAQSGGSLFDRGMELAGSMRGQGGRGEW